MSPRPARYVVLNTRIVAAAHARVSVFDRGLLYGDGLFETLRAYAGVPFALDAHLVRLQASAQLLGFGVPHRPWRNNIRRLLKRNRLDRTDAWVRITLTRGLGLGLLPSHRSHPTLIITTGPIDPAIARAQRRGVRVTPLPFDRAGFLAGHKVLNYLPGVLGKAVAAQRKAFEGLYVDARQRLTEGTTSNVFMWRGDRLYTPAPTAILPGITRRLVMEAAIAAGIGVCERAIRLADLLQASEAFLTSSLAEVIPIVAVDRRPVGSGRVGLHTRRVQRLYRQMIDQTLAQEAPSVTLRARPRSATRHS